MREKAARLAELAAFIAKLMGANVEEARQAGLLAKADLTTGMVGEFPDLQGIMGGYYARAESLPETVADAIANHYKPLGPSDTCPHLPISVATALADKLDTLTGFFAINEPPTGSRDPYALRRAALGVIRLIVGNKLTLPLRGLLIEAARLHGKTVDADVMLAFFGERLKVSLREEGIRHDYVEAVLGASMDDDLLRLRQRAEALTELLATDTGASLLVAYRRADGILRDKGDKDTDFDDQHLVEPAERKLGQALAISQQQARELTRKGEFQQSMTLLASLREPIDDFFAAVRVNDSDQTLRLNRLKMLGAVVDTIDAIADFSRIEG